MKKRIISMILVVAMAFSLVACSTSNDATSATVDNTKSTTTAQGSSEVTDPIVGINPTWAKTTTFYEIFVRSFADSNGDGIGDFQGIIENLDYLKELGVDVVYFPYGKNCSSTILKEKIYKNYKKIIEKTDNHFSWA